MLSSLSVTSRRVEPSFCHRQSREAIATVPCRAASATGAITTGRSECRSRGGTRNKMIRAFMVLIALPLAGCFMDQERLVASCEIEAIHTYPREKLQTGAHVGDYIEACMEAHGYNWNLADRRCHVTSTVERNPYCYTPSNWLDRQLYIIEEPEP